MVHHFVELFAANILCCGQRTVYKLLLNDFLDSLYLVAFACVDNRNRCTLLACTTCTTASVGVAFNVVGQSVVDDVGQIVYVQSTSGNVGSHEELHIVLAELLHCQVALLLTEVAVQGFCIVSVANQLVSNLLCLHLRATEDYGEYAWVIVYDAFQCQILVLCVYHIIYMVHLFGSFVTAAHYYFLVIV